MFFLFVTLCFTPLLYSLAPVSKYLVNLHYTITKKIKIVGLILVMNAINHGFNSKGDTFNLGMDRGVKRYYYFCGKENLISWTSQVDLHYLLWLIILRHDMNFSSLGVIKKTLCSQSVHLWIIICILLCSYCKVVKASNIYNLRIP